MNRYKKGLCSVIRHQADHVINYPPDLTSFAGLTMLIEHNKHLPFEPVKEYLKKWRKVHNEEEHTLDTFLTNLEEKRELRHHLAEEKIKEHEEYRKQLKRKRQENTEKKEKKLEDKIKKYLKSPLKKERKT